jgi:Uri superfamily endonuclease
LETAAIDCLESSGIDTAMDLPEEKGTYILIASMTRVQRVEIGALGEFEIVPGFYAYVGSAFGSGGLAGRIGHHLESTAEPHWHVDYLLRVAVPIEVWYTTAERRFEHHWAELLENSRRFRVPIPRFGSSDYHRSRLSHLFFSKRRPSFQWFERENALQFEGVRVLQVSPPQPKLGYFALAAPGGVTRPTGPEAEDL